jgi:hypothetical protein
MRVLVENLTNTKNPLADVSGFFVDETHLLM